MKVAIFGTELSPDADESKAKKISCLTRYLDAEIYCVNSTVGWHVTRKEGRYHAFNGSWFLRGIPLLKTINKIAGFLFFKYHERHYDAIIIAGGIDSAFLDFIPLSKCVPYVSKIVKAHGRNVQRRKDIIARLKGAITESDDVAKELARHGLSEDKILVVAPPITMHPTPSTPKPTPPPFRIVFASAPVRTFDQESYYLEKGIALLLDAVKRLLQTHDIHLTLVWRGDFMKDVQNDIKERELDPYITIMNEHVDMNEIYGSHHIVAIPYLSLKGSPEFPLSAIEGLCHELPVVTTPLGELASMVLKIGCGTVAQDITAESFAKALASCIEDYDACIKGCGYALDMIRNKKGYELIPAFIERLCQDETAQQ